LDERSIQEHTFDIVVAFDEVIAAGYKEKVTLQQIKTFTEMDSHEERIFEILESVCCYCCCCCRRRRRRRRLDSVIAPTNESWH
jgi:hypothetical protein